MSDDISTNTSIQKGMSATGGHIFLTPIKRYQSIDEKIQCGVQRNWATDPSESKRWQYTLTHNFIKCWPIFKILSTRDQQQICIKLGVGKKPNFVKYLAALLTIPPLDSSQDFMRWGGLRFSLSLIVSELWRHQRRHNERCGLHPQPWTT